jgi:hypothetical protein
VAVSDGRDWRRACRSDSLLGVGCVELMGDEEAVVWKRVVVAAR